MRTHNIPSCYRKSKRSLLCPPDLALLSVASNYPCLELICMVQKVFEPLKFDYTLKKDPLKEQLVLVVCVSVCGKKHAYSVILTFKFFIKKQHPSEIHLRQTACQSHVGTHRLNQLILTVLMRGHNICFH